MTLLRDRPTWCYLIEDPSWNLLYVGITYDITGRLRQHRHDKPWWPRVDIVQASLYPNREYASAWEAAHISGAVRPRHNIDSPPRRPLPPGHFMDCVLDEVQLYPGVDF